MNLPCQVTVTIYCHHSSSENTHCTHFWLQCFIYDDKNMGIARNTCKLHKWCVLVMIMFWEILSDYTKTQPSTDVLTVMHYKEVKRKQKLLQQREPTSQIVTISYCLWGMKSHFFSRAHQVLFSRLSTASILGSVTVGLCLLWEGIAGRTWTVLRGSAFNTGRKEQRDWLCANPDLWDLEVTGGGRVPKPRVLNSSDFDFFTPLDTWSGGKETAEGNDDRTFWTMCSWRY